MVGKTHKHHRVLRIQNPVDQQIASVKPFDEVSTNELKMQEFLFPLNCYGQGKNYWQICLDSFLIFFSSSLSLNFLISNGSFVNTLKLALMK